MSITIERDEWQYVDGSYDAIAAAHFFGLKPADAIVERLPDRTDSQSPRDVESGAMRSIPCWRVKRKQ
jgi:hypothetical protein